jgi:hypothetical protein
MAGSQTSQSHLADRYRALVFGAAIIGVAYCVSAGPAIDTVNADSLVPIFVSLEEFTPFYWGQDRFGMLLPLLASPVRDGFWNLMFQNTIGTVAFLVGLAGAFRVCSVPRPATCALILLSILLVFPGENVLLLLTTNQSYGPALGCYGLATYCYRQSRRWAAPAALVLVALGTWMNAGVSLLAICCAAALLGVTAARQAARTLLIGSAISLGGHFLLQQWAARPLLDITHATVPAAGAITSLGWSFIAEAYTSFGPFFWAVTGILWITAFAVANRDARLPRESPILAAAAIGMTTYALVMAFLFRGHARHLAPTLPLVIGIPLAVVFRRYPQAINGRGIPGIVLVALMLQTGLSTPRAVRRDLLAALSDGKEAGLLVKGVTVVTGDYWDVWPLAFATNLLHEQIDGSRPVVPIALRSDQLVRLRASQLVPGALVAVVKSDTNYWRHGTRLPPLEVVQRAVGYDLAVISEPKSPH